MKIRETELLAPAGSYESLAAAVNAGANAVYIGGNRFGARAYANNLDEETMLRAIDFAHLHNCRLYLTVNTLFKEAELSELRDYLAPYYEAGLDAVLVQDLGVLRYLHEAFPALPLHISTQMTVTGRYSAADLKAMGAVRVVPARELSLPEISEIVRETGLEVETFVHGALCYCYSGQCLFSSLIGGRSGNRGRCAQTCRLPFDVQRGNVCLNPGDEKYVLSLKDLNTLELLPELIEAGVCSFKIEGRMKSPRYTAGVVSIYRKYLDLCEKRGRAGYRVDPADKETLLSLFDRGGQSEGYYKQHNGRDMVVLKEKPAFRETNQALYDFLDRTYVETVKKVKIRGRAYFKAGEPARFYGEFPLPETGPLAAAADGHGAGQPNTGLSANGGDRKTKGASAAFVIVWIEGDPVQEAQNAPMDEERIRKQLAKTGDSPFAFEKLEITVDGRVFVPVQALNRLRRELLEAMERELTGRLHREPVREISVQAAAQKVGDLPDADGEEDSSRPTRFLALVNTEEQLQAVLEEIRKRTRDGAAADTSRTGALSEETKVSAASSVTPVSFGVYLASEEFDAREWQTLVSACHAAGASCALALPRIFRTEAETYFKKHREEFQAAGFDAVLVGSMEEPGFFRDYAPGLPLVFDHGMYAANHLAEEAMRAYGAARQTIPVELNEREILAAGLHGEMIVYGYLPVMVSAQCIRKTTEGCSHRPELLYLRDRKGKRFPVRNQCRFCYNTIYNESSLSLHGLLPRVKRFRPEAVRLNFTVESGRETAEIFDSFYREWAAGERSEPRTPFTRGHFKRGVE